MTRSWFPDLIGPTTIAPNGGTPVGIRLRRLNIISSGAEAEDNPATRRTDLTMPAASWNVVSFTGISTHGEWLPFSSSFVAANLIRVSSSVSDTTLIGLETSPNDPTTLVKFISNVGTNTIQIAPPGSPIAGKQYFAPGSVFALTQGSTLRTVWDSVSLVYRIHSVVAVANYIVIDGNRIVLDGNPILNPE